jgi:hypothetical protein
MMMTLEVAETTVKRLLCYGFRRTGKAMGQVYQYWSRNNFCFRLEYHMFYFLYPFVTHLLTLSRTMTSYLNLDSVYSQTSVMK